MKKTIPSPRVAHLQSRGSRIMFGNPGNLNRNPGTVTLTNRNASASLTEHGFESENRKVVPVEEPVSDKDRPRYDGDSAMRLYMREIGQVPLITPAQEVELAKRIKQGDKTARELMIRANLRLVVKIARDYENYGMPLLDLINEGNIGLTKAVDRFNPAKGAKLSTYSSWWIKQSIQRGLADQAKTIRLPVHIIDKIGRMKRLATKLHEELGHEPTDEDLAAELGWSSARIAQLRTIGNRPASLNAPIGDNPSDTFEELIVDEAATDPYMQLLKKADILLIRELLEQLDRREKQILIYRFGFNDRQEKTLEEVGAKFRVTRERIRQLQNVALAKLRKAIEKRRKIS